MSEESAHRKTEMSMDGQDWPMAETQISISIMQRPPVPKGTVTDLTMVSEIIGKTFAEVGAKKLRKTLLDLLQQSCGEEFEETEHIDAWPFKT